MSEEQALIPVEQKQVTFYDDEITAVLVQTADSQTVYVPIRPICDFLGVTWSPQRRRIMRDPVLSQKVQSVTVTVTDSYRTRGLDMLCLPLDYLNGWLFGINANRVKPEIRDRLIRYQEECYRVLADAFREGRLTTDVDFDQILAQADPNAVQAYQMAQAIVKLARNQILLETRLTHRLDDHQRRLEDVEATLANPDRFVTRQQASRISQAVRAIGHALSERSGRNEYGAVYGELYRKFDIAAYRELPAHQYEEAMQWLNEWYQQIATTDLPF